ncbi:MAG: winged helix DNA-binding domain-containing protein [Jatrophihabitantaceae bacterium]
MITVTTAQRRARLGWRHRLAAEALASSPVEVATDLVALHGTDPSSVYLAAWARMKDGDVAAVSRALYEERSLIRLLAMRRTVFVASLDVASVLQAACSRAVAARERRKLESTLEAAGIAGDIRRWLAETEQVMLRALTGRGEATAAELATDDPRFRTEIVVGGARQNVASRMLFLLAAEGKVVRGRPRGSWTSHQYNWSTLERWTAGGLAEWDTQQAEVELGRRWLTAFGPGTAHDLGWWAGWTKTQVKRVLAALDAVPVELGDGTGYLLPEDLEPAPEPQPWAALLPALDSTPMGWHQREWFLGEHGPLLFDGFGNIGPSLWWNGAIVGGWAHDRNGEIVVRFLQDVGSEAVAAAQAQADLLAGRLGSVRLTARTRGKTWLEQELTS